MYSMRAKSLNIKDVAAQIKNGFALVPEDRQSQGLIQTLDIGKNTAISSMKDYVKGLFLDEKAENAAVDEQIKDIHIKVADKRLSNPVTVRWKPAEGCNRQRTFDQAEDLTSG